MQVTKVYLSEPPVPETVLAYCTVILDNELQVNDIQLKGSLKSGVYILMPATRDRSGRILKRKDGFTNRDVVHPVSRLLQDHIKSVILDGYKHLQSTGKTVYHPRSTQ